MNEFNAEVQPVNEGEKANGCGYEEVRIPDYDEQPYGNDNVLVRASKRRAYLMAATKL